MVALGDGDREEILTYNEIMELINNEMDKEPEDQVWTFEDILDHRKIKGNKWEVFIKWTTGEQTWEPLEWIAPQYPVSFAKYAEQNNLLHEPGWKRFRRYLGVGKRYIRQMEQVHAACAEKLKETRIKFGVEVPRNYKDALRIDKLNGNTL